MTTSLIQPHLSHRKLLFTYTCVGVVSPVCKCRTLNRFCITSNQRPPTDTTLPTHYQINRFVCFWSPQYRHYNDNIPLDKWRHDIIARYDVKKMAIISRVFKTAKSALHFTPCHISSTKYHVEFYVKHSATLQ